MNACELLYQAAGRPEAPGLISAAQWQAGQASDNGTRWGSTTWRACSRNCVNIRDPLARQRRTGYNLARNGGMI